MSMTIVLVVIIVALALGCLLLFVRQQKTLLQHQADRQALESGSVVIGSEKKHLQEDKAQLQEELRALQASYAQQTTRYAELEARTSAEQKSLDEKIELLQKNREQLSGEFENLANRIFDEKAQKFELSSKQSLEGTLSPLKQQLSDFRSKVEEVYSTESKERHLLKEQITQLREDSLKIGEDANNLTRALKHDNKAQGN